MRFQGIFTSAVIGLAAVSVAMPVNSERGIVCVGQCSHGQQQNQGGSTPSSTTTSTTTTTQPPTSTPTFNSGQWQPKQMNASPDDGQWNATKYDDADKFDNGQYHPNKTLSATESTTSGAADSQTSDEGTQVSGGLSLGLGGGDNCYLIFFCAQRNAAQKNGKGPAAGQKNAVPQQDD